MSFYSIGLGVGTQNRSGQWLEVYYPAPIFQPDNTTVSQFLGPVGYQDGNTAIELTDDAIDKLIASVEDVTQKDILTQFKIGMHDTRRDLQPSWSLIRRALLTIVNITTPGFFEIPSRTLSICPVVRTNDQ